MVALARMQRAGGESLGDALPFQLHNLLATRPEISRQGFQASTDFPGKCRRVHVPLYLQHPGCVTTSTLPSFTSQTTHETTT